MKPKCLFCELQKPCMVKDTDVQYYGRFPECIKKIEPVNQPDQQPNTVLGKAVK